MAWEKVHSYLRGVFLAQCCYRNELLQSRAFENLIPYQMHMTNELSPTAGKKGQELHEMVFAIVPTVYRDT